MPNSLALAACYKLFLALSRNRNSIAWAACDAGKPAGLQHLGDEVQLVLRGLSGGCFDFHGRENCDRAAHHVGRDDCGRPAQQITSARRPDAVLDHSARLVVKVRATIISEGHHASARQRQAYLLLDGGFAHLLRSCRKAMRTGARKTSG